MTLATMMTETVEILRRSVTGEDSSGNEISAFTSIAIVSAFVSRAGIASRTLMTGEEIVGRDQLETEAAFMFPPGTDVGPYDRLIYDGRMYEVTGLPAKAIKPGAGEQFIVAKGKWTEG